MPDSSFPQREDTRTEIGSFYAMEYGADYDEDRNLDEMRAHRQHLSLPLLTVPILGVESVWSTEMAFASPYLVSLGLPKSVMASTFLVGPLSGFLVQPLVGGWADASQSRFGRRRPFMLAGTLICGCSMLLLGYGRALVTLFTTPGSLNDILTIILVVGALYIIDFSVNAVMAVDRALIVDVLPPSVQDQANAWGSRMLSLGNLAGFYIGNLNLPRLLPWLGSTQLQIVSAVTTLFLVGTHLLTALYVKEIPYKPSSRHNQSLRSTVMNIYKNSMQLPETVRQVCVIQLWSSQFPHLFFSSIFVGDLYRAQNESASPDDAARAGSWALFCGAVVGVAISFVVPWIQRTFVNRRSGSVPANVTLAALWTISQLVSAVVMFLTGAVHTAHGATVLVAILGFCTSVHHWTPYALIGEALLLDNQPTDDANETQSLVSSDASPSQSLLEGGSPKAPKPVNAGVVMGIHNASIVIPQFVIIAVSAFIFALLEPRRTVIGGANVEPSAPPSRGPSAVVVIFGMMGFSYTVAAWKCFKLARHLEKPFAPVPS